MTKSELIARLAKQRPDLDRRYLAIAVNTIFENISEILSQGGRVELRGFGSFSVRRRDSRLGRNPRTGEIIRVREKHIPYFRGGKELRKRLNP